MNKVSSSYKLEAENLQALLDETYERVKKLERKITELEKLLEAKSLLKANSANTSKKSFPQV